MFSLAIILLWLSLLFSLFFKITDKKIILLNYVLIFTFLLILIKSISIFFDIKVFELFYCDLIDLYGINTFFMLIFSIVSIAILFYYNYYYKSLDKDNLNYYTIFTIIFFISMLGVIISSEAFTFLVFWELMSLSSYFLVIHDIKENNSRINGIWYLILTHIWMFFILISFLPFVIKTNSTFFNSWNHVELDFNSLFLVFVASFIWFGSKSGIFPFHIWLPKAHPIAPSHISALMSWFMVKLPVFMLLKFYLVFMWSIYLGFAYTLLIIWAITAFWWIFNWIIQNNIKKFLAYSTIENMGLIYVGLWIILAWLAIKNNTIITLWIIATLLHIFNHSIYKTMMFSMAWSLISRTHHNYDYSKLWWVAKILPVFSLFFLLWTLSIAGIPPFNWFTSEFITYTGLIQIITDNSNKILSLISLWSLVLIGIMSILAFVWFTKLYTIIFTWNPQDEHIKIATYVDKNEYVSYFILSLMIIILSIFPWIINLLSLKIYPNLITTKNNILIINLSNTQYIPLLIIVLLFIIWFISYLTYKVLVWKEKKVEVWNCWYPYLIKKSQYTAESLIQAIRRLYKNIYSETNSLNYISEIKWKNYYKEYLKSIDYSKNYFLKIHFLYKKIIDFILFVSYKLKSMQSWILQDYVLYMMLTLIFVILYVIIF